MSAFGDFDVMPRLPSGRKMDVPLYSILTNASGEWTTAISPARNGRSLSVSDAEID